MGDEKVGYSTNSSQLMNKNEKSQLNTVIRPSQSLIQSWIQKHADLLAAERKIEQEEARLLVSNCPPKQLERHGLAILGLGVQSISVGLGGKTLIELERPAAFHSSATFPPHQLRPGDIVQIEDHSIDSSSKNAKGKSSKSKQAISDGNQNDDQGIGGVVFRISDTKLIIAASNKRGGGQKDSKEGGLDLSDLPLRIRVVKVANDATFDRMEWTLTRLAKALHVSVKTAKRSFDADSSDEGDEGADEESVVTPSSNGGSGQPSNLIPVLMGQSVPQWNQWPREEELRLFNENLNPSQIAAIKFAMNAQHFSLIHGPPGTGKTTAVAEMVLQLALVHQKRVLVCGASNLAADNLLERILSKGGDFLRKSHVGITRIGHPARVLQSLMTATLDYQIQHSSEGALVKDVRKELEEALSTLRPKESTAAGNKSTSSRGQASSKFQRVRGSERKEKREEIKALRKEFRKRERGLVRAVLKKASIVVATCHGAGARQLDGMEFDVVVIDEACQATEATCWTPILKAKHDGKVILAGDHLQLPPTVKGYRHSQYKKDSDDKKKRTGKEDKSVNDEKREGEDDEQGEEEEEEQYVPTKPIRRTNLRPPRSLETTLFSRLLGMYGPGCKALLDIQYRMNKEIMAFPNMALYEGKIQADKSCERIRLTDLNGYTQEKGEGVEEEEETDVAPIVFYDTAGCEMFESQQTSFEEGNDLTTAGKGKTNVFQFDSKANVHEVELVVQHVQLLLQRGLEPEKISILSPYNLQVSALADRLRGGGGGSGGGDSKSKNNTLTAAMEKVIIGSVDSMQGMENEVVIISLVRSNEEHSVGFLAEKRRLNVAMTRAKRQLCIIGDSETIGEAGDSYLNKWMKFLDENSFIEPVMV